MTINIISPIYWTQTFKTKKDKVWLVSLNNYRNWHYHTSNRFKTEFGEVFKQQLPDVAIKGKFITRMRFFYGDMCDPTNVLPVIDKVLLDVLQKEGTIPNDNAKHHLRGSWGVGGQDKDNPRVEIRIKAI